MVVSDEESDDSDVESQDAAIEILSGSDEAVNDAAVKTSADDKQSATELVTLERHGVQDGDVTPQENETTQETPDAEMATADITPPIQSTSPVTSDVHVRAENEAIMTSSGVVAADVASDDACFALIEEIRRDKFGVDVAMDEHVKKLFQSHKEIIGRSLDRLSKDLYR